jgi:hypothetical protein
VVKAMLGKGLTVGGAAQALGWPKAKATAHVKLLELRDKARELIGADVIPLSAVDQFSAIGKVSPVGMACVAEAKRNIRSEHPTPEDPIRPRLAITPNRGPNGRPGRRIARFG